MSTNTIKQLSNTKENEDLLNLSEFGSPGRAIEMNLSNAKMTFSKEKIDEDARLSAAARSSSKKVVSSKLQVNYPPHGSKSNLNWIQKEGKITEERFMINNHQIQANMNQQAFHNRKDTPGTGDRRNSAVQADIMITDDDDQSLKEQFTDDLMTPSLVTNKLHDSTKRKNRHSKKKKGPEGYIIITQKSPPATITPNFISSVQIIQSSNCNHKDRVPGFNQGSGARDKSKKSKGQRNSPSKP